MTTSTKARLHGEDEVRRLIPDFDLYRLDRIKRLIVETDEPTIDEEPTTSVWIKASYASRHTLFVTLVLRGVRNLRLPRIGPALGFSELEVHDIRDRGLEGLSYHVQDYGSDGLVGDCRSVELVEVSEVDPVTGVEVVKWKAGDE